MKKFILLSILCALFYSAPGHAEKETALTALTAVKQTLVFRLRSAEEERERRAKAAKFAAKKAAPLAAASPAEVGLYQAIEQWQKAATEATQAALWKEAAASPAEAAQARAVWQEAAATQAEAAPAEAGLYQAIEQWQKAATEATQAALWKEAAASPAEAAQARAVWQEAETKAAQAHAVWQEAAATQAEAAQAAAIKPAHAQQPKPNVKRVRLADLPQEEAAATAKRAAPAEDPAK